MRERLGRLILGDDEVDRMAAERKRGGAKPGHRLGYLVTGGPAPGSEAAGAAEALDGQAAGTAPLDSADADGDGYDTVEEIRRHLTAKPELLDDWIARETRRSGKSPNNQELKPRKTAFALFLSLEVAKGAAARPAIVAHLAELAGVNPPAARAVPPEPATPGIPVAEIASALESNPGLVDRLIAAEKALESPRPHAFRAILEAEQRKPEPRAEVVAELRTLAQVLS